MRKQTVKNLLKYPIVFFILSAAALSQAASQDGQAVYEKWCDGCHADSPFAPGTIQLRSLRGNDQALLLKRKGLSPAYLRHVVRQGMNGMPLFRRTEINNEELEALIRYLSHN